MANILIIVSCIDRYAYSNKSVQKNSLKGFKVQHILFQS